MHRSGPPQKVVVPDNVTVTGDVGAVLRDPRAHRRPDRLLVRFQTPDDMAKAIKALLPVPALPGNLPCPEEVRTATTTTAADTA
jgi:hypothetical protein